MPHRKKLAYVVTQDSIWLKLDKEEAQDIVKALDSYDKHNLEPNKIYPHLKEKAESSIELHGMIISDIEELLAGRKAPGHGDDLLPMNCFLEGDHLQIVRPDFENLQESDAMFIEMSDEMCAEFCKLQGDD